MNAFAAYAAEKARPDKLPRKLEGKPYAGGVLAISPLEQKMREKQRLSRTYRRRKREETKAVLASEPRLADFLRYLRTVTAETGVDLIDALETCDWLKAAPQPVRIFALRMISARCDKINQQLGNDILDDPLPPNTSIYFKARSLLHEGGRV